MPRIAPNVKLTDRGGAANPHGSCYRYPPSSFLVYYSAAEAGAANDTTAANFVAAIKRADLR